MIENPSIYSYAYFKQLHEVEERHWWSRGMRDIADTMIQRHFGSKRGLDVLDAGCGTGITLSWLQRYSTPHEVVGIDVADHALDFCRERGHTNVAYASVEDLPYEDASFDLIVCNDVIQHLVHDQKALREFYRVLRPGGCLNVRTNCKLGIETNKAPAASDYRMYTPEELKQKVAAAGLVMEQITYVNMLMSLKTLLGRYLRERHEASYADRGLPIQLLPSHLSWLNKLLHFLLKLEALYLSDPSHALPFGSAFVFQALKPDDLF